jgi:hypothetical protein
MSEYGISPEEVVYAASTHSPTENLLRRMTDTPRRRVPFWRGRRPVGKPHIRNVVKVSSGAVQVRMSDGTLRCGLCPFACMAASEPCEFKSWFGES